MLNVFQIAKFYYNSPTNQKNLTDTINSRERDDGHEDPAESNDENEGPADDDQSNETAEDEEDIEGIEGDAPDDPDMDANAGAKEKRRKEKLKLMCRTRWIERHDAFTTHLVLYPNVRTQLAISP